eukprot:TRINITY_DN3043_c0_g1_i4.p1 TRINITY_DN3043_c0_g1~~TRINITY_DN3043_c0_g1_i4.p1  ORF type:complete len:193 (-),score=11.61 TRINITY_DN3043_c0_g1_i4:41-619(-)
MNMWKQVFFLYSRSLRWCTPPPTEGWGSVEISSDQRTITHTHMSSNCHRNMKTTHSIKPGEAKRSWSVLVDGMDASGMWLAVGVTDDTTGGYFDYGNGHFIGYSSIGGNLPDTIQQHHTRIRWASGSLVDVSLNRTDNQLTLAVNGSELPVLPVPATGELWPWVNLWQRGTTATLLSMTEAQRMRCTILPSS